MNGPADAGKPSPGKPALKERVRHELREYAVVAGYLFACLSAVLLYKSALLESFGVRVLPLGLAVTKALILGKFLLVIGAVGTHTGLSTKRWLRSVPMKTVACFLSLLVLLAIEEAVVGWIKGLSLTQTLAEHRARSAFEVLTEGLLMLLMLFPLIAANQLREAQGDRAVRNLLSGEHSPRPD